MAIIQDVIEPNLDWVARQIYWRCPPLRTLRRKLAPRHDVTPVVLSRQALRHALDEIGVGTRTSPVMVHSSLESFRLPSKSDPDEPASLISTAQGILSELLDLNGDTGTLVMPTYARYPYQDKVGRASAALDIPIYDPANSVSCVGLLNELFRRHPKAKRSLHPLNSVSCIGQLADAILADNLHDDQPTPHGEGSSFHHIYQNDGLIVGLGLPLVEYLTILHVAEDLMEATWPVRNFYAQRQFDVVTGDGVRRCTVRERRFEFQRCLCEKAMIRDLTRAGILQSRDLAGILLQWADARAVVDHFLERNARGGTFPYFLPALAGPFR